VNKAYAIQLAARPREGCTQYVRKAEANAEASQPAEDSRIYRAIRNGIPEYSHDYAYRGNEPMTARELKQMAKRLSE
jgi:hypothetical protein